MSQEKSDAEVDIEDFIEIYKSRFGMPPQCQGRKTYIKDYLFKLLEFKEHQESADELFSEEFEG